MKGHRLEAMGEGSLDPAERAGFNTPSGHTLVPLGHNPIPSGPHLLRSKRATCLGWFCHTQDLPVVDKSETGRCSQKPRCSQGQLDHPGQSCGRRKQPACRGQRHRGTRERPDIEVELRTTVHTVLQREVSRVLATQDTDKTFQSGVYTAMQTPHSPWVMSTSAPSQTGRKLPTPYLLEDVHLRVMGWSAGRCSLG